MPSNGVTISVTAETNAGGRKHMEDYIAVNLSPNDSLRAIPEMREQAYVGVFDGHGGKEAAKYARENLWEFIQRQPKFQTQDVVCVREAIKDAYLQLHKTMGESRALWQPNKTGDLSTAGTTASTVIFRKNHIFVANVGDSTGIMGVRNPKYGQPGEPPLIPQLITKDHKPEDPEEQENIRKLGGQVAMSMKGVMRVVWERERVKSSGKKEIDLIPFLSVARSLGDFWSFNSRSGEYAVSPVPHIYDFPLDLTVQKFIVVASDGLWNVMTPSDVVNFIYDYDNENDKSHQPKDVVSALIQEALSRWERRKLQADNIAVLVAYLSEEEPDSCTGSSGLACSASKISKDVTESTDNDERIPIALDDAAGPSSDPSSSSSSSSSSESINMSTPPDRLNFENKMKLKHRKKHKKHKKHSLERELARRGIHRHKKSPLHTSSLMSDSSSGLETNDIVTDVITTPIISCDTLTSDSVQCGLKRKRTPEIEEDEGVSLDEKRIKPDLKREIACLSTDTLLALRSQRLSTDAGSDSGSSGIVSDMESVTINSEDSNLLRSTDCEEPILEDNKESINGACPIQRSLNVDNKSWF